MIHSKILLLTTLAAMLTCMAGCSSVKYSALEKIGVHKREILVKDVTRARDAQEDAKEEFKDALDQFSKELDFDGGDLEDKYKRLSKVLDRSEVKAEAVSSRIAKVEHVAGALFKEWKSEFGQYNSAELRRSSKEQYDRSRARYHDMIEAMRRAEEKIEPVLKPLRDQVLYLKHNLNAAAISSIKKELVGVENDVDSLIRELEKAISEADEFIKAMNAG